MNQTGVVSLHELVRENDVKRLEECLGQLDESSDAVNARDAGGDTPLHVAVAANNVPLIRLLKKCGADLHARNKKSASCVVVATHAGDCDLVKELLSLGAFANDTDALGNSLANIAAIRGDIAMLGTLQESRANFLSRNYDDGTIPIMNAILNQRDEAFHFLKSLDVDPKVFHINRTRAGKTALHLAVELEYQPALDFFLALPIAAKLVNEADEEGESPVHQAARAAQQHLLLRLKEAGADLSHANKNGQTAADVAQSSALKQLLQAPPPSVDPSVT